MGRPRSKYLNLPPRVRAREQRSGKVYYYLDVGGKPRREVPLGDDYALMLRRYAELEMDSTPRHVEVTTFRYVAERYRREVMPMKASRTQSDNTRELDRLFEFFNNPPAPLEQIRPIHIRQFMDRRKDAPIRANREKALFSHIWNKAREWGYTDKPNPCEGIKGYKEKGRDVYVEDGVYLAVWECADVPTQEAMDLAYLSGQRPADVLKMRETDIKDGAIWVTQGKTGKKLRLRLIGELADLIVRIMERKRTYSIRSLAIVCNESGQALTKFALRARFDKARAIAHAAALKSGKADLAAAIARFQFRDLRAKAGTDKAESAGMMEAQKQLGHESIVMTQHYVRSRKGEQVDPTK